MKTLLKLLGGLVVITVVAVGVILWRINPILASLKPKLEETVSGTIHAPVKLGDISLSYFPELALRIDATQLGDPTGPDGGVRLGEAFLKTSLSGIFSGKLTVSDLELRDLIVEVVRRPDGTMTVGGIPIGPKDDRSPTQPQTPPATTTDAQGNSLSFSIAKLSLKNGRIAFRDLGLSPAVTHEVKDLNVELSNIVPPQTATFDVQASVFGLKPGNFSLKGNVAAGASGGGGGAFPTATISMALEDLALEKLQHVASLYGKAVDPVVGTIKDSLAFNLKLNTHSVSGTFSPEVNLILDLTGMTAEVPGKLSKAKGVPLKIEAKALPRIGTEVQIETLNVTLGNNVIEMPMTVPFFPALGGPAKVAFKTSSFDLRSLEQMLPALKAFALHGNLMSDLHISIPNVQTPTEVGLDGTLELKSVSLAAPAGESQLVPITDINGTYTFAGKSFSTEDFGFSLAGQAFRLKNKVEGLPSAPQLGFELRAKKLDFNPVITAIAGSDSAHPLQALQGSYINELVVASEGFQIMQQTGLVGIAFNDANLKAVPLGALRMKVGISPATLTVEPSSLSVFGGTLALKASYGLVPGDPVSATIGGKGMSLAQIVGGPKPGSKAISVTGTVDSLKVNVTGTNDAIPQSLRGPVQASVGSGTIEGVNLIRLILDKINFVPGATQTLTMYVPEKYRPLVAAENTAFDRLNFSANLGGGNIAISEMLLDHHAYSLRGSGNATISGNASLTTQFRLKQDVAAGIVARESKTKLLLDKENAMVFPVLIKKDGASFTVIPDIEDLLKRGATNAVKDAAKRELEKRVPGLGGASQLIDKLF